MRRLTSRLKPVKGMPKSLSPRPFIGVILIIIGVAMLGYSTLAGEERGSIDVKFTVRPHIVSAAYKAYGKEDLGFWLAKTAVINKGSAPIYDVKISYMVEGFTDWSQPKTFKAVPPGGAIVDLYYPVLPSSLSKLTSATPSKVVVRIEYKPSKDSSPVVETFSKPITVLGVNDIVFSGIPPEESTGSFQDIFSNYPLLAAWVTPSDPILLRFAGMVAQLAGGPATTLSDQDAITFLAAAWKYSVLHGISYQTESQAYWSGKFSEHIKFPRDVLRDHSGTCIDTAIFFASLAMSQGLEAYIVLMPGHAFPIIKLPSGALVPVETTLLNKKVDFQQAVEVGVRVAQQAFQGPYIIVDIASWQAKGIVPPELPELPPHTLEAWGYKPPEVLMQQMQQGQNQQGGQGGTGGGGGQGTGGGQGGGGGGQTGGGGGGQQGGGGGGAGNVLANTRVEPYWAVQLPNGKWDASVRPINQQGFTGGQAVASEKSLRVDIIIIWIKGVPAENMRMLIEKMLERGFQGNVEFRVQTEQPGVNFAGEQALLVAYDMIVQGNKVGIVVARYFSHEGYGFAVLYMSIDPVKEVIEAMENALQTFQWVAGG